MVLKQVVFKSSPFGWTAEATHNTPGAGTVALAASPSPRAVEATVVIGTIKKNCSGHGICKVLVGSHTEKHKCRSVMALIDVDAHGAPRMAFPRAGICARLRESHFHGPTFLLEEEFVLPTWLNDQLELSAARLEPGRYPIHQVPGYYLVTFRSGLR